MYGAPRPRTEDDPLFAVRLAAATALAYGIALWLRPAMPMIAPACAGVSTRSRRSAGR